MKAFTHDLSDSTADSNLSPDEIQRIMDDLPRETIEFYFVRAENPPIPLEDRPHRAFLGLFMVYRIYAGVENGPMVMLDINSKLAQALHLSEPELFDLAIENTRKISPIRITSLAESLEPYLSLEERPVYRETFRKMYEHPQLWVIQRKNCRNASVALLYDDILEHFRQIIGDDYYLILPSRDQLYAIRASRDDCQEIIANFQTAKYEEKEIDGRQIDKCYFYNGHLQEVTAAEHP